MIEDFYLKFSSEGEAYATLIACFGANEDGTPKLQSANHFAVDVKTIFKATGEKIIVEGESVDVMVARPGYHVNVRMVDKELPTQFEPFALTPDPITPTMVFA